MTTFGERLAAAREARPTRDVSVILDGAISAEKDRLEEELENVDTGDMRLGTISPAEKIQQRLSELTEESADSIVTIRLTRLPGRDWSTLTSKCPPRPDVPLDTHYGYNYDAVCEASARYRDPKGAAYGHRLEDGEPVDITDEEWDDLFSVLAGNDIGKIRDAVWTLNEYEPAQRLAALVKASGAATRSVSK